MALAVGIKCEPRDSELEIITTSLSLSLSKLFEPIGNVWYGLRHAQTLLIR